MINSEIEAYSDITHAIDAIKDILMAQLEQDEQKPEWYDFMIIKTDSGMAMEANFNQSKKDFSDFQPMKPYKLGLTATATFKGKMPPIKARDY